MHNMVKRMGDWLRRRKHPYLIAYTIVFFICALACFWPFIAAGKHLMWKVDGLQAHYVRFTTFGWWVRQIVRESLRAGSLVVPQWNLSLGFGSNIVVYVTNYIGNPFNYISIALPQRLSGWGFDAAILLQLYSAGLSFTFYVRGRNMSRFQALVGSVCYAFSGWTIICLRQYVFIYPLVLFPLLLWSIDRVFHRKSPVPFIACVSAFFLYYFYFAYMACVLAIPYCLLLFRRYCEQKLSALLRWVFAFVGLIAVGVLISGILLCPTLLTMLGQSRLGLDRDIPLLYSLKQYALFPQGILTYASFGASSTFSWGPLAYACIVLMFARRGRRGLKAALVLLSGVMLIPAAGSVLNGFQYATNRWMWAYSLCISYVVAEMVPSLGRVTWRELRILFLSALGLGLVLCFRPGYKPLYESPMLLAAFAGLLAIIVVVGIWSLQSVSGFARDIGMRRAMVCAGATLMLSIPFYYAASGRYAKSSVTAGEAWSSFCEQPAVNAVETVSDDSLWRWDYSGTSHLHNTDLLMQMPGFDIYANLYDSGIDAFLRGVETSDAQEFQTTKNLCSRSYLESALGAKYFAVGSREGEEGAGVQPCTEVLPYGTESTPIASSDAEAGGVTYVYRNELALPLAYLHDRTMSMEDYERLTATQKQQAILQAVAVENGDAGSLGMDATDLAFDDVPIDYTIVDASAHATHKPGQIATTGKSQSVLLELDNDVAGEVYVEFVDLTYENHVPRLKEDATQKDIETFVQRSLKWEHATEYKIEARAAGKRVASLSNRTRYSHMYAADNTNILNLGYSDNPVKKVRLVFEKSGIYSFSAINVFVQPVTNLRQFVEERRSNPVELSMGVNSFVAKTHSETPQVLFLSIPWSRGWNACVDGVDAEVVKAYGAFMAIELPAGNHTVALRYETPGLKLGCGLSVLGLVLTYGVGRALRARSKR